MRTVDGVTDKGRAMTLRIQTGAAVPALLAIQTTDRLVPPQGHCFRTVDTSTGRGQVKTFQIRADADGPALFAVPMKDGRDRPRTVLRLNGLPALRASTVHNHFFMWWAPTVLSVPPPCGPVNQNILAVYKPLNRRAVSMPLKED